MPRPSRFIADQFREVDQSVQGIGSTGEAQAKSLQTVGEGIGQLGDGIAIFEQKRNLARQQSVLDSATNAATEAHRFSVDFALTNPDARRDGKDFTDTYTNGYQEIQENFMDGLSDDVEKDAARIIFDKMRLKNEIVLDETKRKMQVENIMTDANEDAIGMTRNVAIDPDSYAPTIASLKAHTDAYAAAEILGPAQRKTYESTLRKKVTSAAIFGRMRAQEWDQAIFDINEGEYSMILSQEEKEKQTTRVENAQNRAQDGDLRELNLESAKLAKGKKDRRQDARQEMMVMLKNAKTPEEKATVSEWISDKLAQNDLSNTDATFGKAAFNTAPVPKVLDSQTELEYVKMKNSGDFSVEAIRKSLYGDVGKRINFETAIGIDNSLEALDGRGSPKEQASYRRDLKRGQKYLDNMFGNIDIMEKMTEGMDADVKQLRIGTRIESESLHEHIMKIHPDLSPYEASIKAGEQMTGQTRSDMLSVEGIPRSKQNTVDDLESEMLRLENEANNFLITRREADTTMLEIENRIRFLEAIDIQKNSIDEINRKMKAPDVNPTQIPDAAREEQ